MQTKTLLSKGTKVVAIKNFKKHKSRRYWGNMSL